MGEIQKQRCSLLNPTQVIVVMIVVMRAEPTQAPQTKTIESLIREHYDAIYHLALSMLDDPDTAADAAQETFIAASNRLDRYRGDASYKTWLFAIGINTCRTALRRQKSRSRMQQAWGRIQSIFQRPVSVEGEIQRSEQRDALWNAVDRLEEHHRLPVLLHYLHGFSAPEIAEMLSVSEGTIHSRLFYARKQLKSVLEVTHD